MDKIIIEGGLPLKGEVRISGAKNAALPILAATLLAPGEHRLANVPPLADIRTCKRLLASLGARFKDVAEPTAAPAGPPSPDGVLLVDTSDLTGYEAPYELVKTMRAAVLVLGPLVARARKAKVSLPGGCAIGARPIDLHLKGLEAMGVKINLTQGYVEADARRLKGAEIYFDTVTVTGTENLMMAATLAKGTTVIRNAAMEPEVGDLARFLVAMGAQIEGIDSDVLTIHGVRDLPTRQLRHHERPHRSRHLPGRRGSHQGRGHPAERPDAPPHRGDGQVHRGRGAPHRRARPGHGAPRRRPHRGGHPHPSLPRLSHRHAGPVHGLDEPGRGASVITETIFENRFMHVSELTRLGADITVSGNLAVVRGRKQLQGAPVMATDLRASASLVVAGLAAAGTTEILRVYHLDRGYAHLVEKLAALGARITRVPV